MTDICIADLESAIDHWRQHKPSPDGFSLPAETRALAAWLKWGKATGLAGPCHRSSL